ncbi:hypothetical protein BBJ28_00015283 [Nothophytophthora sp. Chile5]|nr:hypothetical protein BBJ28_00015283 [Nothophytophthora sp. Chile5]
MASEKKPPLLPRGDSAAPVSARDASFWLALASAPSSSRSGASSEAGSFLWSLRGHTILPGQPAETEAAPLTSPPASLASLYDSELFVPTRLGVPRSSRGFTSSSSNSRELRPKKSFSNAAKRPPVVETEEVYEHQRYQLLLGWGAKGHLLPLDPDKYMRVVRRAVRRRHRSQGEEDAEDGETRLEWLPSVTFPDIALPDARHTAAANAVKQRSRSATTTSRVAHVLGSQHGGSSTSGSNCRSSSTPSAPRWEWVSPWHLELPVASSKDDGDGWQYASSFSQFSPRPSFRSRGLTAPPPPSGSQSDLLAAPASSGKRMRVRRRKWVRYRRLRSGRAHATSSASSNAFDDAFLDSMSGWLRKRGHVRKNWKARYFVLEKSVLRYYADAARTKLKGEVLLFHPQTRVHYVDVHVAGGRDASFAVQVGPDYMLLLQAAELRDRENWMYCIEDALLCRDSYHPQTLDTQLGPFFDLRESVAQRRLLSAEAMALDGGGGSFRENLGGISHAHGGGVSDDDSEEEDDAQQQGAAETSTAPRRRNRRAGSDVLRLWASLHAKPGGVLSAVSSASPTLRSLLRACDQFLASPAMRQHIAGFLLVFRQKYETSAVASASASAWTRLSEPWAASGAVDVESDSDQELRDGSLGASPQELQPVTTLQDARSLLALKNYRFFLERSLERVVDYLAAVTDPNTPRALGDTASNGKRAPTDDEWALARRAALYKLERRTFIPLQEVMYQLLAPGGQRQEVEERFERLRMLVGAQSQSFLEIPPSHQSPSEWQSAVALLNSMDNYSLPSEKAAVLVEVARCIYETHAREHGGKSRRSEGGGGAPKPHTPMAADDFLPIFIFVLARCRLRSVIVARHLISETMITALMIGETGYYATMLEAAIGYVAACDAAVLVGELADRGSGSSSTAVSGC